jgi:hypothetical protein
MVEMEPNRASERMFLAAMEVMRVHVDTNIIMAAHESIVFVVKAEGAGERTNVALMASIRSTWRRPWSCRRMILHW